MHINTRIYTKKRLNLLASFTIWSNFGAIGNTKFAVGWEFYLSLPRHPALCALLLHHISGSVLEIVYVWKTNSFHAFQIYYHLNTGTIDRCEFGPFQLISHSSEDPATKFTNLNDSTKVVAPCVLWRATVTVKFPDQVREAKLLWLNDSYYDLTVLNKMLLFKVRSYTITLSFFKSCVSIWFSLFSGKDQFQICKEGQLRSISTVLGNHLSFILHVCEQRFLVHGKQVNIFDSESCFSRYSGFV